MNELHVTQARGRPVTPPADRRAALLEAFARESWAPSGPPALTPALTDANAARLRDADADHLTDADADRLAEVAAELHPAFSGDVTALNQALVRHAAVPNLHGDPPLLAFHAPGAELADAWAADAATALAMVIGVGQGRRLRSCEAEGCELVFFDITRNASRRFCGLPCQNRAKASAYRARRRT
ncbi:CGNR zinc finger domain-containing protein [Nonomuraea rubra]